MGQPFSASQRGLIVDSSHGAGGVTEGASGDLWGRGKVEDRKPTLTTYHLCVSRAVNAMHLHPQGVLCIILLDG